MNARNRRLAHHLKCIIRDHGQGSLEMIEFAADHPITMKLLLARIKKDNDYALKDIQSARAAEAPPVEPLLGPGDPE